MSFFSLSDYLLMFVMHKVPSGDFWCPHCLCVQASDLIGAIESDAHVMIF